MDLTKKYKLMSAVLLYFIVFDKSLCALRTIISVRTVYNLDEPYQHNHHLHAL